MFDLGLGSLEALSLEELVSLLFAMVMWIVTVALIGIDTIVIAIVIGFAIPFLAELLRRAWRRGKSRLRPPD
jgi:hypothetical protein